MSFDFAKGPPPTGLGIARRSGVRDADEAERAAIETAVAADQVAALELSRPEIANELQPVSGEQHRHAALLDSEDAGLAELLDAAPALGAAVVLPSAIGESEVVVIEHDRAAWPGTCSHERKHRVHGFCREIERNARPDEQRLPPALIAGALQRRRQLLTLEVVGHIRHMFGQHPEHLPHARLLQRGGHRMV